MVEKIRNLLNDFEYGRTQLNIYDLAFMIKEITEEKLKEEE
ncbi:hypothetical protein Blue_152 [Bacillus phage Deep Blue]|uniref:Uncharacterized protein n=1 Tax=Bacillus phage Deep Blue TaxID=1792245 RepID=A0A140HLW3_9CAUD|nr:hypothetical protein Blue_152 [Bacillus phage Deep Blue]AMO25975.1 hypothetical protein Blue_152 [Bacillus phage Deep Blue]